jgi:hypothetical protein
VNQSYSSIYWQINSYFQKIKTYQDVLDPDFVGLRSHIRKLNNNDLPLKTRFYAAYWIYHVFNFQDTWIKDFIDANIEEYAQSDCCQKETVLRNLRNPSKEVIVKTNFEIDSQIPIDNLHFSLSHNVRKDAALHLYCYRAYSLEARAFLEEYGYTMKFGG